MDATDFKYDVAFSFTQQDEDLALKLYKLLKDRLNCFVYSEQQKKLAGGDGEVLFNSVFAKESRIVIILYRNEYGKTKWTRIEETAIKNRAFEDGYDFVILIPTAQPVTPPKWLPKNRLWIGLERWGIESAASVIEARVQEFGGEIKIETLADLVSRKEIERAERLEREQILSSSKGLELALEETKNIVSIINKQLQEIKDKTSDWRITLRPNRQQILDIICYGYFLTYQFAYKYSYSLSGSRLYVGLWHGYFDEHGRTPNPFIQNTLIDELEYQFDINDFNENGWSLKESRTNFINSAKLVDKWLGKLITQATKNTNEY